MSGLPVRIISALFGLALIFGSYYLTGKDGLAVVCALAILRVLFEYGRLHFVPFVERAVFFSVCTAALIVMHFKADFNSIVILFAVSVLSFFTLFRARSQQIQVEQLYFQFLTKCFGVFYCVWLPLYVVKILYIGETFFWFVSFMVLVFLGDTAAYFVGIKWGKHRLIEVVSPKKSIEGAAAALIFTTLTSFGIGYYLSESLLAFLVLGVVTSLLAQSGDLVESLIKRASHVKDAGQIMPGHGGMMDRLDGVYWAAPFFFWFISVILRS
jgi:phosphatidate cytidylyltransferase